MNGYTVQFIDGNKKRSLLIIGSMTVDEIVTKIIESSENKISEFTVSPFV
jgi:hypothetical protein